jgi:hypothetical protein
MSSFLKVVVVGGGVISNKLVSTAPAEVQLSCFTVRRLPNVSGSWTSVIEECQSADIIVYLAYHHRDFLKNMRLLGRILSSLKRADWHGQLVFFNTQSALASTLLKSPKSLNQAFSFDLYTTTKRLQSWLLSRYSRQLNISEIYLPVVLGVETKAQKRYDDISRHKVVHLPNKGANLFAYLDVDIFLHWFWRVYLCQLTKPSASHKYRKVFVYQGVRSFADMIGLLRANRSGESKSEASEITPLLIKDCIYKYRFSNDLQSNLVCSLKMTPIWLVLSVLRNELKKLTSSEWEEPIASENPNIVDTTFYPMGAEYQYLCTTIDLDVIPFNTIKIES